MMNQAQMCKIRAAPSYTVCLPLRWMVKGSRNKYSGYHTHCRIVCGTDLHLLNLSAVLCVINAVFVSSIDPILNFVSAVLPLPRFYLTCFIVLHFDTTRILCITQASLHLYVQE